MDKEKIVEDVYEIYKNNPNQKSDEKSAAGS